MKRLKVLQLSAAVVLIYASAFAHEQPTHRNITLEALQYLSQTKCTGLSLACGTRPGILQFDGTFVDGSWNEDAYFNGTGCSLLNFLFSRPPCYLGLFYFHFLPPLNDLGQSGCDSIMWGIDGDVCTASTHTPLTGSVTLQNNHTWQDAIGAADPVTDAPTDTAWDHLGYVIHLLEDLTSPPHTRSSAHPCALWFLYCDPFEKDNKGAMAGLPQSEYVDFSHATIPEAFFKLLQNYTLSNYYSARTVFTTFDGNPGPCPNGPTSPPCFEDNNYFYGPCVQASSDFRTPGCNPANPQGRKIAHKGFAYRVTGNPNYAEIDAVIAHEQFNELGPVTVEAVADFIRFYAPMLTVATDPTSTGTGTISSSPGTIDCGTICSSLVVRAASNAGAQVQLTATPDEGSTFTGWGGDCTGTDNPVTVDVKIDKKCTAIFGVATPAVVLSPYGSHHLSATPGPYDVQVVNSDLATISAPANITVTLLRQVFSACRGLLFVSQITASIPQGQTSVAFASAGNVAGRDPFCMSSPITTTFTVQQATLAPNTVLNLSTVPSQQLSLSITR